MGFPLDRTILKQLEHILDRARPIRRNARPPWEWMLDEAFGKHLALISDWNGFGAYLIATAIFGSVGIGLMLLGFKIFD